MHDWSDVSTLTPIGLISDLTSEKSRCGLSSKQRCRCQRNLRPHSKFHTLTPENWPALANRPRLCHASGCVPHFQICVQLSVDWLDNCPQIRQRSRDVNLAFSAFLKDRRKVFLSVLKCNIGGKETKALSRV